MCSQTPLPDSVPALQALVWEHRERIRSLEIDGKFDTFIPSEILVIERVFLAFSFPVSKEQKILFTRKDGQMHDSTKILFRVISS